MTEQPEGNCDDTELRVIVFDDDLEASPLTEGYVVALRISKIAQALGARPTREQITLDELRKRDAKKREQEPGNQANAR